MHLESNSPALTEETAATKIQAGFRGYRVRKELKQRQTANPNQSQKRRHNSIEERSATKIQAGIRGFLVRKRQRLATEAATKIQASFRAFKARKDVKKLKGSA